MAVKMGGWVCKISNFQDIRQFLGSACMIFARASAPWKIFCFLLKFLLKKCYKCRIGSTKSESMGVGWLIEPRSLLGGASRSPPTAAVRRVRVQLAGSLLVGIPRIVDTAGIVAFIHSFSPLATIPAVSQPPESSTAERAKSTKEVDV